MYLADIENSKWRGGKRKKPQREFLAREALLEMKNLGWNHYKNIASTVSGTTTTAGRDYMLVVRMVKDPFYRPDVQEIAATLSVAPFNALQDNFVYNFKNVIHTLRMVNIINAPANFRVYKCVYNHADNDLDAAAATQGFAETLNEGFNLRYGAAADQWCTATNDITKLFKSTALEQNDVFLKKVKILKYRDFLLPVGGIETVYWKHKRMIWWPPSQASNDAEYTASQIYTRKKGSPIWIVRIRGSMAVVDADNTLSTSVVKFSIQQEVNLEWSGTECSHKIHRASVTELVTPAGAMHRFPDAHVHVLGTTVGTAENIPIAAMT